MSVWSWRACLVLVQGSKGEAEEAGCAQCFGVVLAEDSAAAGEGVVEELLRLLVLAQGSQGEAEEAGKIQCVGVVLAVDAAAAGEGIALKLSGLSVVAQRP